MSDLSRYARQIRYAPFGQDGQERLATSRALVVGCGALGTVIANTLVRAGVGHVRIVDRDFVELTNLQRQVLFDEDDIAADLPKAVAAAKKLSRVNSQVNIEPIVADVSPNNIQELAREMGVIVDGTDNFETRYLINDLAVSQSIPWVYGGCIGAEGQSMTILPGETGCLRCLMPEPPPVGATPTCDTAGVVGPIVNVVASIQAMEAIKVLSGHRDSISRSLSIFDVWENRYRQIDVSNLRNQVDCPCCHHGEYLWLSGDRASQSAILCGRNAVQLNAPPGTTVSLDAMAEKLAPLGEVTKNRYLLRLTIPPYLITLFPDGRAIIGGTDDVAEARTAYARYVGT
jgi:adenylyltransferase/sulfurtransferase